MKILKLKKSLVISLTLVIILFFFFIYSKYTSKNLTEVKSNIKDNIEKSENFTNSNIIKGIKYTSKDLKGNEYTILAKEGEIDLNNGDIIFLKEVSAFVKMSKNNEIIKIVSDFGKYNTISYDTIFSKNVKIEYIDNIITGNYLDFSMTKNLLIISKNVIYTNPENILHADVVELNTITKDTKIFMYNSNDKVTVESIN